MIVMLDTGPKMWDQAVEEVGYSVEQLITPLTRYTLREGRFAIDNGAFSRFDPDAFSAFLKRHRDHMARCRFVAMPDVVGSARRTLECFDYWYPRTRPWPVALVAQDGIEDFKIRWDILDAIFIGGTDAWKTSKHAEHVIRAAKSMRTWVHVGRVNTESRFAWALALGVDSIDGTGISRYSWMRECLANVGKHPQLALDGEP